MKNIFVIVLLILACSIPSFGQSVYFADGYHGGVFGHYPMWQTQFMVDKLDLHPEWSINLELEPETWDTVMVKEPIAYQNFKKIVTEKRIDFVNPTYAQPYLYNISGESIIRQFEYGMQKIQDHFPEVKFITYSAEEPCFTSCLPQVLKSFGIQYAVLKNPDTCWGGYMRAYGGQLVNWIGPDQTSILTVPRYASEELEDNSTWQTKAWNNSDDYLKAAIAQGIKNPIGMCFQDAGWENGPWIGHGENIKNKSIYTTWTNYIENISDKKSDDNWRMSQEDVLVNLMWGSQALQRIAQEVRSSENKIITAEKLSAMANIESGYKVEPKIWTDAWRSLMLAQHHDSWIVPYNRLHGDVTWAQEITNWTNNTNFIADKIVENALLATTGTAQTIKVYNTLSVSRNEVVSTILPSQYTGKNIEVYDAKQKKVKSTLHNTDAGLILSFEANVPSFGYASFTLKELKSNPKNTSRVKLLKDNVVVLENNVYKITLDLSQGGKITSLVAKKVDGKEFVDANNEYSFGELKGYFYEDEQFYSSTNSLAKLNILQDDELVIQVSIVGDIAGHPFTQLIKIEENQKAIDFDLTIDWKKNVGIGEYKQEDNWRENRRAFHDDKFKLNVYFPTNLTNQKLFKNAPFDVCESALETTSFNTWDNIKNNIILNWVDVSQADSKYGFTLLSDHVTSYSHGKELPLALTLQYSGQGLWWVDYTITKPLNVKYAIIPHKGKWDTANIDTESNMWNDPLLVALSNDNKEENKSLLELNKSGYTLSAFKQEGDDFIVRLFNAEGDATPQKLTFNFPVESVEEVMLNGETVEKCDLKKGVTKTSIQVEMPRFGLKTYRVKRTN